MDRYRILIVHRRTPVSQALLWCFEQFGSDEVMIRSCLEPNELARLNPNILLADVRNFLQLTSAGESITCPVLLLAEQMDGDELLEAVYLGVNAVADLRYGPEEVITKARKIQNGEVDDALKLIKVFLQSQNSAGHATEKVSTVDYGLTGREREILVAMRQGIHLKLIAYNTKTSYDTVRTHVKHIYKKLGVASASEAVIKAMQMNL